MSSTEWHPSSLATSQVFSADHFSPRALKHQYTIDCLTRPFAFLLVGSLAASESDIPAVMAAIAAPFRIMRRFGIGMPPDRSTRWEPVYRGVENESRSRKGSFDRG